MCIHTVSLVCWRNGIYNTIYFFWHFTPSSLLSWHLLETHPPILTGRALRASSSPPATYKTHNRIVPNAGVFSYFSVISVYILWTIIAFIKKIMILNYIYFISFKLYIVRNWKQTLRCRFYCSPKTGVQGKCRLLYIHE